MPELVPALVAACLLLFVAALELPVSLAVSLRWDESGLRLKAVIGLFWGLLRFCVVSVEAGDGTPTAGGQFGMLPQVLLTALNRVSAPEAGRSSWRRKLLGSVAAAVVSSLGKPGYNCVRFEVHVDIGFTEASDTALATGLVYACLGVVSSAFGRLIRFAPGTSPEFSVTPSYAAVRSSIAVDCIFRISLGYIIRRGIAQSLKRRFASGKVA